MHSNKSGVIFVEFKTPQANRFAVRIMARLGTTPGRHVPVPERTGDSIATKPGLTWDYPWVFLLPGVW